MTNNKMQKYNINDDKFDEILLQAYNNIDNIIDKYECVMTDTNVHTMLTLQNISNSHKIVHAYHYSLIYLLLSSLMDH